MKTRNLLLAGCLALCCALCAQTTQKQARRWMKKGAWSHGWTVKPDASTDAREFASQYAKNTPLWDSLFTYLATTNLDSLSVGKYVLVDGKLWVSVSEYVPRQADNIKIESHRNFIDLQYTSRGTEYMGLALEADVETPYNEKRDVALWKGTKMEFYPTAPDRFFLFFPNDRHQPSIRIAPADTTVCRKIVAKIAYQH
jgi:YhcH/YjgK/YiaL family protein